MPAPDDVYLSLVVTTRNDDHGGNMLERMQVFLDLLAAQTHRTGARLELIVVEWNPPPDSPSVADALRWPEGTPLRCRVITVPGNLHRRFENSERIRLFQMIAKNVGLRRARGRFILATNIDVLFSDELVFLFSRENLDPECVYRLDRFDVPSDLAARRVPPEEVLEYCRRHVIRVHRREQRPIHTNACGDFTLMAKEKWLGLMGYPELPLWSIYLDSILLVGAVAGGLKEVVLGPPYRMYHIDHDLGWAVTQDPALRLPCLDFQRHCLPWWELMLKIGAYLNTNTVAWGLAGESLEEIDPAGALPPRSGWLEKTARPGRP
ncbi:MAG: hypothetical protein AB1896_07175 [Thermodesulfobacteriota bacterium]